jgi:hypothetical protein
VTLGIEDVVLRFAAQTRSGLLVVGAHRRRVSPSGVIRPMRFRHKLVSPASVNDYVQWIPPTAFISGQP